MLQLRNSKRHSTALMIPRLLLLLVTSHVADCQSTAAVDSNDCQFDEQQTNALFDVKNQVTKMRQQNEHIQTELHLVREQLQQLLLKNNNDNDSVEVIERVRPRLVTETTSQCRNSLTDVKPGTPTVAHSVSGSSTVIAVTLLDDQLFVSRDHAAQVSVYDRTSLELQRQLTFTGLGARVWGMAACEVNKYLYISDHNNHCIHRVDMSIANSNTLIRWDVAQYPHGLTVKSNRNLLVTCYQSKKVQEYTPTGSLVREISDGSYLFQAVELNSGTLAVSRSRPAHGIMMTSLDGQVQHSYGNEAGSGVRQFNMPFGLTVDTLGHILVADHGNNRILVMNPLLTDARQLPLPIETALENPNALYLDQSRGRLYVGEKTRLLVFDNVTNVGALFKP